MNRLSRRDFVKLASLAGAAAVASSGTRVFAATETPSDLRAFISQAYARRAQMINTGDTSGLDQIYDPANVALFSSERERPRYVRASKMWEGDVLWNASTVEIVDLDARQGDAHARLIERLETRWRPRPILAALRDPRRLGPVLGPDRATSSVANIRHEIDVSRSSSGWRIVRDQHDAFDLGGRSPDLVPGGWAAERYGKTTLSSTVDGTRASGKAPGLASPAATHLIYNASDAYVYGQNWATWPGNSAYCNYNDCGGDCTNFVSQCFRAGGHPDIGAWRTFNGACMGCSGQSSAQSGDTSWIRVNEIWGIILNNGRGFAEDNVNDLWTSHMIQYDWDKNGVWDHATMTTFWSGGSAYVVSHTPHRLNYHWQLDDTDAFWRYAFLYDHFHT